MTLEEKVDRLERILKLILRTGRVLRTDLRHQDEKISIVIDVQIQTEDKLKRLDVENKVEIGKLSDLQRKTDRRVDELVEIIGKDRH